MSQNAAVEKEQTPAAAAPSGPGAASVPSVPPPAGVSSATTMPAGAESSRARLSRKGHRARLQAYAVAAIAVLVYVVALGASNTRQVKVDWVFGHASVALIWLVLGAAILGWLLGILVTKLFRWRTRAPRAR